MNYPILDQWLEWECAAYAVVACLMRMKQLDGQKLIEEMRPDFNKMLTSKSVWLWLRKKWYIKDIVAYRYNPLTIEKIPLIVRLFGVDWSKTRNPPYKLTMGGINKNAHYVAVVWKWKIVNSWWEEFGDKWYFYFDEEQKKNFWNVLRLIL